MHLGGLKTLPGMAYRELGGFAVGGPKKVMLRKHELGKKCTLAI